MPVYEYRCTGCSSLTDIRHGFDDVITERCVACGGELIRNFNVSGIVFKGAGFYKTDSRGGTTSASDATPAATPAAPSTPAPAAPAVKPDAPSAA